MSDVFVAVLSLCRPQPLSRVDKQEVLSPSMGSQRTSSKGNTQCGLSSERFCSSCCFVPFVLSPSWMVITKQLGIHLNGNGVFVFIKDPQRAAVSLYDAYWVLTEISHAYLHVAEHILCVSTCKLSHLTLEQYFPFTYLFWIWLIIIVLSLFSIYKYSLYILENSGDSEMFLSPATCSETNMGCVGVFLPNRKV